VRKFTKTTQIVLICLIFFVVGFGINWVSQEIVYGSQENSSVVIPIEKSTVTREFILPKTETMTPNEVLDEVADFKRGALLTKEIRDQLELSHSQIKNKITLQTSDIILEDSRAYVKVCMSSLSGSDPLDFGTGILRVGTNEWINFFVHKFFNNDPEIGRCLILEYFGIPNIEDETMNFSMAWVGYVVPDEGKACEAYDRRSKNDQRVSASGVEISCDDINGTIDLQIIKNERNLSEDDINKLVMDVIAGVQFGPWEFELNIK